VPQNVLCIIYAKYLSSVVFAKQITLLYEIKIVQYIQNDLHENTIGATSRDELWF